MIQQEQALWRFGSQPLLIQLLALLTASTSIDNGITQGACTLASLLFWICSGSLLLWHRGRASRMDLLFVRWGLLAFVLIGTPLLWPVVEQWAWLQLLLLPIMALLFVVPLLHVVAWVFGLSSPFDGKPGPPDV